MPSYTADYLYPIAAEPIKNGIVTLDDHGTIIYIQDPAAPDYTAPATPPEKLGGILIPGFVNAHCHLELSHLRGRSATGKTLLPFLVDVVTLRGASPEEIEATIRKQDRLMWEAGIQAVGDICNQDDTAATKRDSPIRYYSFVEMFDFLQAGQAEASYERYLPAYAAQPEPKSAVPHAPYTVSEPLYSRINALNTGTESVSIHNQETPAEDELFQTGQGAFREFFAGFGASLDDFKAPGTPSIYHALQHMDPRKRTLFVHNTLTAPEAILAAEAWGENGVYWVTCPNANLYIENRLPRYDHFLDAGAKVCIGTDSLTSNWQLSILEELRTISRYQSYVPLASLLRWATLNGAEALQFDADLGSLERGKTPGLLNLTDLTGTTPEDFRIGAGTQVRRIA
ncbi:amidohydrolase family protein [Lewinella sp. IMCC34183]|uniref:amidohydrolase family protein n=1 Tax=Lewinella sp. IMCC34183 TaxID=2248762 RepID=UPI0018E4E1EA|nr:amidohydrolase family protein [Lewinella sp. IMCC34183]